MDVLKVFTEEPFPLDASAGEPVPRGEAREMTPLEDLLNRPMYARAYLAGSRLVGDDWRVGLTALENDSVYLRPLQDLSRGMEWSVPMIDAAISWTEISDRFRDPPVEGIHAAGRDPVNPGALTTLLGETGRRWWRALRDILDAQPECLVFVPTLAHDGYDWTVYSGEPLRARLIAALHRHPAGDARRLVMPYQKARGEHKFYLERWALDDLPDWVEEV